MKYLICFSSIIFLALESAFGQNSSISWRDIQQSKKGSITVYWFPNEPFGYEGKDGELKGIEVEIVKGFQKYLKDNYEIDLLLEWKRLETFKEVLGHIKNDAEPGIFGVAGFSFTEERKTFMKFSPSYMADMAVLVSTPDIPTVRSKEDLKKYFDGATALTAQGTILEKELIRLRDEDSIHFKIEYTGGSDELIKVLRNRKKSFGYLNLPVYLMDVNNGLTKLNRQSYLTKRYEGRGIGLMKASDWDLPLREYFERPTFKQEVEILIGRYINLDLYRFIETLNPENEVSLLNREKSLQQMQIKLQELTIREKNRNQLYLLAITFVSTFLLIIIVILFRRKRHDNNLLRHQKAEIEKQANQIQSINDKLELLVQERTRELETKNKALENYAFITAHRLRSPLSTILGLVELMQRLKLEEDDKILVTYLSQSAKQLDEIIHEVMTAINEPDSEGK